MKEDELVHDKIGAAIFFERFQTGYDLIERVKELQMPVLLMHGSGDGMTSHLGSRELAEQAGDNVTYQEWEGLYHEIHNEPERVKVMTFTLDWMEKQLSSSSSELLDEKEEKKE